MEGLEEYELLGFVSMTEDGFALPLYKTAPHANQWYCAKTTISRDDSSTISSFDEAEFDNIELLADDFTLRVKPGDNWISILRWNGETYVGPNEEIFYELQDFKHGLTVLDEIRTQAPLTYLDLCYAIPEEMPFAFNKAAGFLRTQFSESQMKNWFCDAFLKTYLHIQINQICTGCGQERQLLEQIRISRENEHAVSVTLSPDLIAALQHKRAGEMLIDRLQIFASACGLSIEGNILDTCSTAVLESNRQDRSQLPMRRADFSTLTQALDYAARSSGAIEFHNLRGEVASTLTYSELRLRARAIAKRLIRRYERGSHIAVVAETSPRFIEVFFACQYAGMIASPMPMPVNLGGRLGYLRQLRYIMSCSKVVAAIGPESLNEFLKEASSESEPIEVFSFEELDKLAVSPQSPTPLGEDEGCYIQFSSGITGAPKGIVISQLSLSQRLGSMASALDVTQQDRVISWLPLYHAMGLIGCVLFPLATQLSSDLLATSDFVRRPLLWLRIMSEMRSTITCSPPFGYALAAKRSARTEPDSIDLRKLRIAMIGGDILRPSDIDQFSEAFRSFGFARSAFAPIYETTESNWMAAVSSPDGGLQIDEIDLRYLARTGQAQKAAPIVPGIHRRQFVSVGYPLAGLEMKVCDDALNSVEERQVGQVFIKGPGISITALNEDIGETTLGVEGWVDTGDVGYIVNGRLFIVARKGDLIVVNGRMVLPQVIEDAVERFEGIRIGGVAAFTVTSDGETRVIVAAERRAGDAAALRVLEKLVSDAARELVGAPVEVVLVRPHSMVMTSSGKLSRPKVKLKYLAGELDGASASDAGAEIQNSSASILIA